MDESMSKKMFYYALSQPIDFWDGWVTVDEYFKILNKRERQKSKILISPNFSPTKLIARLIHISLILNHHYGFEGDIRDSQKIFIGGLPGCIQRDGESKLIFAIKADSKGATYIISPYELAWLNYEPNESVAVEEKEIGEGRKCIKALERAFNLKFLANRGKYGEYSYCFI